MLNGFARISALLGDVLRLREKGGKHHDLPINIYGGRRASPKGEE